MTKNQMLPRNVAAERHANQRAVIFCAAWRLPGLARFESRRPFGRPPRLKCAEAPRPNVHLSYVPNGLALPWWPEVMAGKDMNPRTWRH